MVSSALRKQRNRQESPKTAGDRRDHVARKISPRIDSAADANRSAPSVVYNRRRVAQHVESGTLHITFAVAAGTAAKAALPDRTRAFPVPWTA
jgi:hypothetical protein